MAVKTFTTGEVLTAADTNTYLNNGGLVYITTATASATGTLEIDGVFTSTYVHYKLLVTAYSNNVGELQYRFNTNGTQNANASYWRRGFYWSGSATSLDSSGTTEHFLVYTSNSSGVPNTAEMEIYSPQESVRTSLQVRAYDHHNAREIVYGGGFVNTTSFTGIDIFAAGGATNWTGSVRVYGYRNA